MNDVKVGRDTYLALYPLNDGLNPPSPPNSTPLPFFKEETLGLDLFLLYNGANFP